MSPRESRAPPCFQKVKTPKKKGLVSSASFPSFQLRSRQSGQCHSQNHQTDSRGFGRPGINPVTAFHGAAWLQEMVFSHTLFMVPAQHPSSSIFKHEVPCCGKDRVWAPKTWCCSCLQLTEMAYNPDQAAEGPWKTGAGQGQGPWQRFGGGPLGWQDGICYSDGSLGRTS
jgi:hypothetical protein